MARIIAEVIEKAILENHPRSFILVGIREDDVQRVSFYTLGCRLNQGETALLEQIFREKGFCVVGFREPADILVVNSCTVTEDAHKAARYAMRRAIRLSPQIRIAIVGCQAQAQRKELLSWPRVFWVLGTALKMRAADIIFKSSAAPDKQALFPAIRRAPFSLPLTRTRGRRVRANLKIQDGCDNFCAYCEVPYARGRSRSRKFSNLLKEAEALVRAGYREIVLTGVNIGDYHEGAHGLWDVVREMERIEGLERIRLSSLEDFRLALRLARLMRPGGRLCRFLHIPLQSGCDRILRRMGRRYRTASWAAAIRAIVRSVPGVMVGTDVIVGFPGETEKDFLITQEFLQSVPVHYIHVFRYSPRCHARSSLLEGRVLDRDVSRRSLALSALSARKQESFLSSLCGRRERAIFEGKKDEYWIGHLDNYVTIKLKIDQNFRNVPADVVLDRVEGGQIISSLASPGRYHGPCQKDQRSYCCAQ